MIHFIIAAITGVADDDHALMSYRMIALVNTERANAGLEQLSLVRNVSSQPHTEHQAEICEIVHQSEDALRAQLLATEGGVGIGENVAHNGYGCDEDPGVARSGWETAKLLHTQWMNSPGHRANILRPEFTHVAFGFALQGAQWFGTQVFTTVR